MVSPQGADWAPHVDMFSSAALMTWPFEWAVGFNVVVVIADLTEALEFM